MVYDLYGDKVLTMASEKKIHIPGNKVIVHEMSVSSNVPKIVQILKTSHHAETSSNT